jgi:alpha-amylase
VRTGDKLRKLRYFDDYLNRMVAERVAERCYLPMNALLLEKIRETEGRFRCSFAVTGSVLRQLEAWRPETLDSFVRLAETGAVEFVCETAFHSLAAVADPLEFAAQVEDQRERLTCLFGRRPTTFRDTELVFDQGIAKRVEDLGFDVLLGEGADRLLQGRSARRVYRPAGCERLKLLLRDYPFSDDIAFRFSNKEWPGHPLMADTYASWLQRAKPEDVFIGLFMDYETFGEHQSAETGILEFMRYLPGYVLADERFDFATPSAVAAAHEPIEELSVPDPVSWADEERDLSAWLSNPMQRAAHAALYELAPRARAAAERGRPELLAAWRKLTTSDHVYYMHTKRMHSDADVHEYFSPYESPHDSFIAFMNVLDDLAQRLDEALARPDDAPTLA